MFSDFSIGKMRPKNHPNSSLFRILHPLESMKKTPPPIKSLRFPLNRIGRNLFRLDFLLNSIGKIIIKNTCPINSFSYRFPVDFVQRDSSGPGFSIQASAALILAPAAVAAFSAATSWRCAIWRCHVGCWETCLYLNDMYVVAIIKIVLLIIGNWLLAVFWYL